MFRDNGKQALDTWDAVIAKTMDAHDRQIVAGSHDLSHREIATRRIDRLTNGGRLHSVTHH
jgi:hypothetical protein